MKIKVGLIPNLDRKTKKQNQKHTMCKPIIQQNLITRMKQK
jgi:hypothetical protein